MARPGGSRTDCGHRGKSHGPDTLKDIESFLAIISDYPHFYILIALMGIALYYGLQSVAVIAPLSVPPQSWVPFDGEVVANCLLDASLSLHNKAAKAMIRPQVQKTSVQIPLHHEPGFDDYNSGRISY